MHVATSTSSMLSRRTLERHQRGQNQSERGVWKGQGQKQIGCASLAAANTNLLVFHAYVRVESVSPYASRETVFDHGGPRAMAVLG